MKKYIFFILIACLLNVGQMMADNRLIVSEVNVPQGGQTTIEIGCEFDTEYTDFELQLSLPDGLTLLTDEDGKPIVERAFDGSHTVTGSLLPSNSNYKFTCYSTDEASLSMPTIGSLLRVTLQADASLTPGTNLTATITACEFTRTADSQGDNLSDVNFTVSITEFRTILDETATTAPVSEENANVRVRRTINAGEWSTICLPFSMTETQVKTAFGEDVELGNFEGTEPEFDDADNVVGIKVNFSNATAMKANHPYIIKVSMPVSEFIVDGVDIISDEDNACIEFDNGKTGTRRIVYSGFYGTYHAGTVLDQYTLFLNGNKFWYSTGATQMKAFRAYFDFYDVLTNVEESYEVKMSFNRSGTSTHIHEIAKTHSLKATIFDLSGRKVTQPQQRGLYIVNGRKLIMK